MFDSFTNVYKTDYVDRNVTITEKRAPTDESIKLLNEMTNKALDNIVKSFQTTNNTLQVSCAVFENPNIVDKIFLCKFTLNQKDYELKVDIPPWEFDTNEKFIQHVYKKVCDTLSFELLQPLLDDMQRSFNK